MRVIAGSAKGRRLRSVHGTATRPTADKVKGAMFSIIASRFSLAGAQVLDVFAGSGALGIEALSRGAGSVTFVEQSAAAIDALRANLRACRFESQAHVVRASAARALTQLARGERRFDGVLADPPYEQGHVAVTLAALAAQGLVQPGGWVVIEHALAEAPAVRYDGLRLTQTRRYGKTGVALLVADDLMPEARSSRLSPQRAVYAGSFDPFTSGHLDVVRRAVNVFDEVIVAVAAGSSDPRKERAFFTAEERVAMIHDALADTSGRARADSFTGLLVDYCDRVEAHVIIRGLRAVSDFEYEFQMAMMNRHLRPHIETFFMAAGETHFYTASRLVKEVASLGGDVSALLPESVLRRLREKLKSRP